LTLPPKENKCSRLGCLLDLLIMERTRAGEATPKRPRRNKS